MNLMMFLVRFLSHTEAQRPQRKDKKSMIKISKKSFVPGQRSATEAGIPVCRGKKLTAFLCCCILVGGGSFYGDTRL